MNEWIARLERWRLVLGTLAVATPGLLLILDVQLEHEETAIYFGIWVQVNLSLLLD